ncbi:VPS10 domain-containing protein [Christiangramia sabulilitoris]|uniref:Glycosyl hydrolase n=1 Tax=Christiangramia sabulilitoris TaxID=2583991 RepID=A0A550I8K0_9FLAO|nr:glycosyl hydrolase [Christiangramia sabulilitoris]TRO67299.1 glycosyl hydrolase [Christiangramia sabulilitoris]
MNKRLLHLSICVCLLFSSLFTDQLSAQNYDEKLYDALEYRLIGPFRGGRSAAVTGVPGKPNLFYFGAAGGGVWKTENGGRSWENLSDGYFGGSIGSIEVAKSDPNVIYVGGGEKTVRGNVSSGYGIWKTEDAGKTWNKAGLEKSRHVARMVTHPDDYNTVYAAVLGNIYKPTEERGVYKSTDGGKNWRKVLFSNSQSGAVDLIMDPNNPRILFASTWNVQRTPYSLSSGGEGSALWKSTDSGENWKEISKNKGFPSDTLGIIGVTVSPVDSDRVWAIVENKEKGGVYRSDDGGESWEQINDDRSLRQRAWYYTRIYADPKNKDIVYVLNVNYHKSTDGGKSFSAANAPHGDHHDLWIAPNDPDRMIMGDDGGAQVTYDGGETWSTYHNQPTAQFYRVTTDNSFPYRIYAAQQDNSTVRIKHRTEGGSIGENDWEPTAGGESAHIAVDPENSEIVYGGSYDGFLTRYNHETGTVRSISVWPDNPMGHGAENLKYRFQWNFPVFFSPHNPDKLYTASNHLHVTTNEGESWEEISPDLTRNDKTKQKSSGGPITQDNTSVEYYSTIFAAAESPVQEGVIWTGSDDGLIHVTMDGGKNWQNVTPKGMPEWMMINSIEPSAFDAGTAYVAGTRYKLGDFVPYLYKTTDFGKSWKKITNGIAAEHFTRVLREDPEQKGLLYAGTETGMYISFDDGSTWKQFQLNLPIVPITDLTIKDNNLIVATQGRSLWIIDDLTLIHQLKKDTKNSNILFKPKDSYRMDGYSSKSLTAGKNHPAGVITYFYLKETENKEVKLSYLNKDNDTIQSFSTTDDRNKLEVTPGANMHNWDMRGEGAEKLDGMILWWASTEAPQAVPGTYKVVLEVDGEVLTEEFSILPNANAEADVAGMQKQYEFISSVNSTVDKAHKSIRKMRMVDAQLKDFQKQYKGNVKVQPLLEKAETLSEQLSEIENALYQTKNRSNQDPLNFPIKLTNKLAHLNSLVGMDDFPPTTQDIAVKNELTAAINKELDKFDNLLQEEIKDFNNQFNELELNYLFVETED